MTELTDASESQMQGITSSSAEGSQTFSIEQAKHQLRASAEAHKQAIEQQKNQHALNEQVKDNWLRRIMVGVGVAGVVGGLIFQ